MKRKFGCIVLLALALGAGLGSKAYWPKWFSRQQPVDPDNMAEDYDTTAKVAIFNNQIIDVPGLTVDKVLGESVVLPDGNAKWIDVDLNKQKLYAYENGNLVYEFLISSGTWDRTPRGTFTVWTKVRSQKMSGGSKELGTYYYLPNVPYILFFYNQNTQKKTGFSIHGTYWHDKFGQPMSHGCVNMKTPEAALIYNWAPVGTQINIYGKYAKS